MISPVGPHLVSFSSNLITTGAERLYTSISRTYRKDSRVSVRVFRDPLECTVLRVNGITSRDHSSRLNGLNRAVFSPYSFDYL